MQIKNIDSSEYSKAKKLWKMSFDDSDEFIDYYFENKVNGKDIFGLFNDEHLISMLVALEKNFVYDGISHKSVFLAGCCTDEKYRKKGFMKKLLIFVCDFFKEKNIEFCFLHPFSHDFYKKLGWQTVSDMRRITEKPRGAFDSNIEIDDYSTDRLLKNYNMYVDRLNGFFTRRKIDMDIRVGELHVDNGHVLFDHINDYYALFFCDGSIIDVIENTCIKDSQYDLMISELSRYGLPISFYRPCKSGDGDYTMVKVLKLYNDSIDDLYSVANNDYKTLIDMIRLDGPVFFEQY